MERTTDELNQLHARKKEELIGILCGQGWSAANAERYEDGRSELTKLEIELSKKAKPEQHE